MPDLIKAGIHRMRVIRASDGDSIHVDIFLKSEKQDLGFGIELTTRLVLRDWPMRLCDINAHELDEDGGRAALVFLEQQVLGKIVTGEFHLVNGDEEKTGKYGRWIVTIIYKGVNINLLLVENGHAVKQIY